VGELVFESFFAIADPAHLGSPMSKLWFDPIIKTGDKCNRQHWKTGTADVKSR